MKSPLNIAARHNYNMPCIQWQYAALEAIAKAFIEVKTDFMSLHLHVTGNTRRGMSSR